MATCPSARDYYEPLIVDFVVYLCLVLEIVAVLLIYGQLLTVALVEKIGQFGIYLLDLPIILREDVGPLTSKGITDLLLLFFVQLRVASPSKKNCLPKREADTI